MNVCLFLVLVAGSVWLFWKPAPRKEPARVLFMVGRVLVVGVWVLVGSACVLFYVSFRSLGNFKDELVFERESPDKLHIVAVFNRYGSAVAHDTTKVSLRSNGETFDARKNAIIFDEEVGEPIDVSWSGSNDLIIRTDLRHVSYQVTKCGDVTITYLIK